MSKATPASAAGHVLLSNGPKQRHKADDAAIFGMESLTVMISLSKLDVYVSAIMVSTI
ncbi:hypothetical protein [Bradyrhizobium murdochi]|uniref:hypothetical protein n=1 Tax=Bradyrhizobium murdochi TaxID=1038859 RepID=UPI0012EC2612|nr:hypothetical protein [Bradyrhizobium murdochi]